MCRVLSGRERESGQLHGSTTTTRPDGVFILYIFSVHKEISCMLEYPLQVFEKKKMNFFIVLEYFLKQGKICSTRIHLQNLNISKLTADLGYNDYLAT